MARFNHAVNNFLSGEISPRALSRSETQEYKQGCEELLNMLPQPQGGVERRPGSQYIASQVQSVDIDSNVRIFPFNISSSESYIVTVKYREVGGYKFVYFSFVNTSSGVETSSGVFRIPVISATPMDSIQCAQYGDYLFFVGPYLIPCYAIRLGLNSFNVKQHRYTPNNTTTSYYDGQEDPYQTTRAYSSLLTASAVAIGSATLTSSASMFVADMVGTDSALFTSTTFIIYAGADYGVAIVTGYTSGTQVTVNIVKALPAAATGGLTTWYESAWSYYRGYPRSICFAEERAIYGGNAAFPNQVWGSAFENIFQLVDYGGEITVTSTVTNAMPFKRTLAATENSQIQWLSSGKKITSGTGGREYQVFGVDANVGLGATNTGSSAETSYGSSYVQSARLDSAVVFVQRSGRRIMEYAFDLREESYRVRDLSLLADHFALKGLDRYASYSTPKFIKMQYAASDDMIWMLDSNGVLSSITRNRATDSLSWAEHDLGGNFGGENAFVTSIAVANSGDGTHDDLWMIVKRTINSSTKYYLERINRGFFLEDLTGASTSILDKPVFVDSAKLVQVSPANTTFTGFSHLEGQTVSCLADGEYVGEKTVSSGNIVLDDAATELIAGLKYTSKVTPTIPDVGSITGSSLGRPKKMDKLSLRFYRTVGAKLLRHSDSKEEEIVFRTVDLPIEDPIPLYTGFKEVDFPSTWEKDEKFTVQTNLPLPMGILGIFVRGTSND